MKQKEICDSKSCKTNGNDIFECDNPNFNKTCKFECVICGADPEVMYVEQKTRRCNVCKDNGY